MNRVSIWILAALVSVGTTTLLDRGNRRTAAPGSSSMNSDGAFRDGLYVGRLAARHSQRFRPPVGRWSNEKDRVSFLAGYSKGYNFSAVTPELR